MRLLFQHIFIAFLVLFASATFAQNASLVVRSVDKTPFFLILDGQSQNEKPTNHFELPVVPAGKHQYKLIFPDPKISEIKGYFTLEPKIENTYELSPGFTGPDFQTYVVKSVGKTKSNPTVKTTTKKTGIITNYVGGSGIPARKAQPTKAKKATTTASKEYRGAVGCPKAMSNSEFNRILLQVKQKTFEDAKLEFAKQQIRTRCFSASQIKKLLGTLDFEDNKLDLAKYSYNYTYDLDNFKTILTEFYLKSSRDELSRYINK